VAAARAVGQCADGRIDEGVADPRDQQHGAHGGGTEHEHVGIELGDEDREHLPEESGGHVTQPVTELLRHPDPTVLRLHHFPSPVMTACGMTAQAARS